MELFSRKSSMGVGTRLFPCLAELLRKLCGRQRVGVSVETSTQSQADVKFAKQRELPRTFARTPHE